MMLADAIQRRYADAFFITLDLAVDTINPCDIFSGQYLGDAAAAVQLTVAQQVKPIAETRGQA